MDAAHDGRIKPFRAELHHHPLPHGHNVIILLWHPVSVGAADMEGQDEVDEVCGHF